MRPPERAILLTGVAGYFGSRVAARLLAPLGSQPGRHVIGVDVNKPKKEIDGLDFVQADVRNPLLVELIRDEAVDTVCHLAFIDSDRPNENAFDVNVMGTVKLLGACTQAGVRKVVLRSSTMVYGALPDNSAFLAEDHALRGSHHNGTVRDLVEIESFINGYRREAPDLLINVLRFANIIGPTVMSPMARFLREMWTPILLGFDPMMQIIHEDDVTAALVHAILNDAPGVFNVAAEDSLPLTQLMAIAGKLPLPVFHLGVYWGAGLLKSAGVSTQRYLPFDPDYLRYSWVGDLAAMHEELGFMPRYTAAEALREFAGQQRLHRYLPEPAALAYDEERLRDTLERRRRAKTVRHGSARGTDHFPADEEYEVEAHGQ